VVKSLEEIPRGERVFVDANIFHLYFRGPESIKKQCGDFMGRIARGEIFGYTSVLVLDEFIYKILLRLIEVDYGKNPIEVLRGGKFDVVRKYSGVVSSLLNEILSTKNMEVLSVDREDVLSACVMLGNTGLLPRDAIHLAVMYRNNIRVMVSMDPDFDVVDGIVRYSPHY